MGCDKLLAQTNYGIIYRLWVNSQLNNFDSAAQEILIPRTFHC